MKIEISVKFILMIISLKLHQSLIISQSKMNKLISLESNPDQLQESIQVLNLPSTHQLNKIRSHDLSFINKKISTDHKDKYARSL